MIIKLGQEIYKMSLGYLVVSESKEVLNTSTHTHITHTDRIISKGYRSQLKELPVRGSSGRKNISSLKTPKIS